MSKARPPLRLSRLCHTTPYSPSLPPSHTTPHRPPLPPTHTVARVWVKLGSLFLAPLTYCSALYLAPTTSTTHTHVLHTCFIEGGEGERTRAQRVCERKGEPNQTNRPLSQKKKETTRRKGNSQKKKEQGRTCSTQPTPLIPPPFPLPPPLLPCWSTDRR